MATSTNDNRLTVNQAASILGIGASSLRLLIHSGKIRFMRIGPNGGRYFFRREWLDEYDRSCEVAPIMSDVNKEPVVSIGQTSKDKRPKTSNLIASSGTINFKQQLGELKSRMKRGVG